MAQLSHIFLSLYSIRDAKRRNGENTFCWFTDKIHISVPFQTSAVNIQCSVWCCLKLLNNWFWRYFTENNFYLSLTSFSQFLDPCGRWYLFREKNLRSCTTGVNFFLELEWLTWNVQEHFISTSDKGQASILIQNADSLGTILCICPKSIWSTVRYDVKIR